ncbi:MAG: tail fiber domain-containing protein, partial [Candidatus Paceibacteria bacterium]
GTFVSARLSGSYTGITGTGALNAGSITSGFGNINIGSNTFTNTSSVNTPLLTNAGTLALSATGANPITASTNGTERLRIDNTGNVGIGTTAPSQRLHVSGNSLLAGAVTVDGASDAVQLTVQNHSTQTTNLQEWQSSAGTTFAYMTSSGAFKANAGLFQTNSVIPLVVERTTASSNVGVEFKNATASWFAGQGSIGNFGIATSNNIGASTLFNIATSGNVGIGTTAPGAPLHVNSVADNSTNGLLQLSSTATGGTWLRLNNSSTGGVSHSIWSSGSANSMGAGSLIFSQGASHRMVINSSGNVGIGTTAPESLFTVGGTMPTPSAATSDITPETYQASIGGASNKGGLLINGVGSTFSTGQSVLRVHANSSGEGNLALFTSSNTSGGNPVMAIKSTGNVGIGTTAPGARLHVAGDTRFVTGTGGLHFRTDTNNSYINNMDNFVSNGSSGNGTLVLTGQGGIRLSYGNVGASGTEAVRIDSSGNVGIGNSSPSEKLHVTGNGLFSGSLTAGAGTFTSLTSPSLTNAGTLALSATGANPITASTNGSERLRITSAGNVGIGLINPRTNLEISVTNGNGAFITGSAGNAPYLRFLQTTTDYRGGYLAYDPTGNVLNIGVHNTANSDIASDTPAISILRSTGNVGIGTTGPTRKLHVNGVIYSDLTGSGSAPFLTANAGYYSTISGNANEVRLFGMTSDNRILIGDIAGAETDSNIRLRTAGSDRLTITNTGNVGIGIDAPTARLHVQTTSSGNVVDGLRLGNATTASGTGARLTFDLSTATHYSASIEAVRTNSPNAHSTDLLFRTCNGTCAVESNSTEKMRITSTGNVGIGTANPLSKLDVSGGLAVGTYAGTEASHVNGMIVSGNVSIGTTNVTGTLSYARRFKISGSNVGLILEETDSSRLFDWSVVSGDIRLRTAASNGSSPTELFRVTQAGNVGINISNPNERLVVDGSVRLTEAIKLAGGLESFLVNEDAAGIYRTSSSGGSYPFNEFGHLVVQPRTSLSRDIVFATRENNSTTLARMVVRANGNVGINNTTPSERLHVDGTIRASNLSGGATTLSTDANGNIIRTPSDSTLKTNIKDINNAMDTILALRGVSFEWIDKDRFGNMTEIGFIAQEVDTVLPELVRKGGEYWALNTPNMLAVVIEAMKEMWEVVLGNKAKIAELENRINQLESSYYNSSSSSGNSSGQTNSGGNSDPVGTAEDNENTDPIHPEDELDNDEDEDDSADDTYESDDNEETGDDDNGV